MVHEFNTNGYIYTERELKSGKNYKMIMKKAYKISDYLGKGLLPEAENITENTKPQNIDLTQKKLNSKVELNFVPSLVKESLALTQKKPNSEFELNFSPKLVKGSDGFG